MKFGFDENIKVEVISAYWDNIPDWNSDGQCFDFISDKDAERIPATKVNSWRDFASLLESDFFNRKATQYIFRGHRRHDWGLTPTLGRLTTNGIVTDELANAQLKIFRQAIRGRVNDNTLLVDDGQEDELWAVGQHYGLMTPLLDWTYSPYVALFFAFSKEDKTEEVDNPYRAIYVLNKTFIESHELCEDIRVIEPRKDDHGRLVNQAGLFTFPPSDATIENKLVDILGNPDLNDDELINTDPDNEANVLAKYICKIYIKNEERTECLRHLRRMNVHYASLFPDLLGASDYCNSLITESVLEKVDIPDTISIETPKVIELPDEATEQVPKQVSDDETTKIIEALKNSSKTTDTGKFSQIADTISQEFNKNKRIDWETRENIQARLRNTIRVVLRKYGYPHDVREEAANKIFNALMEEE
jgi:hypothetical protein